MKEWFKDWFDSPYYHLLYKNRNDEEAQQFVKAIVNHFQLNETNNLLDVACGKGRHSKAFVEFGIDVTGIDLSKNSIDFANQFMDDKLHFYVHDMRQTFRTNYYDIVCNLFTSFGYFATDHDNWLAAKSMYQAVKKGGTVLVDFINKKVAQERIDANKNEELQAEKIKFVVERSYTDKRLIKQITIHDEDKIYHYEESLQSFSLAELTDLFQSVGFSLVLTFGDYQLGAFNESSSSRMILVFKK